MVYIYTIKIEDGVVVKLTSDGRILEGYEIYLKLDHSVRKYVGPYYEILMRGLDKCAIESFTVELEPVE